MSAPIFADDILFLQRFLRSGGANQVPLSGAHDAATDRAQRAFEQASTGLAETLGRFDLRTERLIFGLQLPVQELARRVIATLRGQGIDARIISGTRSYAEQNALFRKGRFGNPGPVVTRSRGGESNHNFGLAWDIGIFSATGAYLGESPLYKKAGSIAMAMGLAALEWGGNWVNFVDQPHYQMASPLSTAAVRAMFEAGEPYF